MKTTFKFFSISMSVLTLLVAILSLNSCYRRDYTNTGNNNVFDNSKTVVASFNGIITDEAGAPIVGAVVKTSAFTATTDDNGLFFFTNINTPVRATSFIVSKDGYFNGSRTLYVKQNNNHTVHIVLLKKEAPQVFNSVNGGTVNFPNGLSISFTANSVVNKATNTPYTGQVYVYAKPIDPSTEMGRNAMPGDLRGIGTGGIERMLRSYGMMVAELYDINGNALQLKSTTPATITLTIPQALNNHTPANIPLWYYDEAQGMWMQQGSATLTGNKYVGTVTHFSFWNCDTPEAAIYLEMTLQDQNGNPLPGYTVKLTNTANMDSRYGTTNNSGWVGGLCYSNATLTMQVYNNNVCGATPVYTNTITTGNVNQDLGIVVINLGAIQSCSFDITVLDCLGAPLANAAIWIPEFSLTLNSNALGQISYTMNCVPATPITIYAYDLNTNVYASQQYTLVAGTNNLGTINACGNVSPFFNLDITNTVTMAMNSKNWLAPADNIFATISGPNTYVSATDGLGTSIYLSATGNTVGTFNIPQFGLNGNYGFADTIFTPTGINTITFTTFPGFPGDLQGTVSLNFLGYPSGDTYTATGIFRAPRTN